MQVWELKPTRVAGQNKQDKDKPDKKSSSFSGSSGASLHTKAMSADDRELFVGSYNLDPRSTWLNCEQGVFVEDATLATQLGKIFELQTTGNRAWRVTLEDGKLRWNDGVQNVEFGALGFLVAPIPGLVCTRLQYGCAALARPDRIKVKSPLNRVAPWLR